MTRSAAKGVPQRSSDAESPLIGDCGMSTAAQAAVLSEMKSRSRYIFSIEMPRMEQGRIVTSVIGTEYQRTGMIPDVERSGKGVGQLSIASVFRWSYMPGQYFRYSLVL